MCKRIQNGKEMWDLNSSVLFFSRVFFVYTAESVCGVFCICTHIHIYIYIRCGGKLFGKRIYRSKSKAQIHTYNQSHTQKHERICTQIHVRTHTHIHTRPSRREMEKVLAEVIFWCVVPWSTMSIDRQAYNVCHLAENGPLFALLLIHAVIADADFVWSLFSLQPSLPLPPLSTARDVRTTTDRTHTHTHTHKIFTYKNTHT